MKYYEKDKIFKFNREELENIDGVYYYPIKDSEFKIRIDNLNEQEEDVLIGNRFRMDYNNLIEDSNGKYILEYEESIGYDIKPKKLNNRIFETITMSKSYGERWALYII